MVYIQRGAKEIYKRDGVKTTLGRKVVVGKTKGATSNRVVPLGNTAIEMVNELREEFYFGEDSLLEPDGTIKCLTPKQVGDLLGHSTSQITEMYYVKRDNLKLIGITDGFEM